MGNFRFIPVQIQLNENAIREALTKADSTKINTEVQLLRTGKFADTFGELEITKAMLKSMVKNFENDVRGVDLMIDYSHESHDIAAGWINKAFLMANDTELWVQVEWTPKAIERLAQKEFRYLSAEFSLDFEDNESLEKFGPTLFGAGLTNRPFVKNMQPAVTLTENQGENDMELDELKKKVADLEASNKKLSEEKESLEGEVKKAEESDVEKEKVELVAKVETLEAEKKELEDKAVLAEKVSAFEKLVEAGKAVPAQKDSYLSGDTVKFAELSQEVNTESKGTGEAPKADSDPIEEVMKLAEKALTEKRAPDMGKAISLVLRENPKLEKEYNKGEK